MHTNTTYHLCGYLNLLPVHTGFVTPVFRLNDSFYIESEKGNTIDAFLPVGDHYHHFIQEDGIPAGTFSRKPGDDCLFAFVFNNKANYGTVKELNEFIQRHKILEQVENESTKQLMRKFMSKSSRQYTTGARQNTLQVAEDQEAYNDAATTELINKALEDFPSGEMSKPPDPSSESPIKQGRKYSSDRIEDIMKPVRQYINDHPHISECSVLALSRRFHIPIPILKAGFKRVFGVSIPSYVIGQCMKKAEELLLNGNSSIASIAFQLGYSNSLQFAKHYKKYKIASAKNTNTLFGRFKNKH